MAYLACYLDDSNFLVHLVCFIFGMYYVRSAIIHGSEVFASERKKYGFRRHGEIS